ncbi:amidohydrolase [Psittacicella hinzii]|uniref:Amidohydrolase n=2 Tax=Psittacicella hinzii TaxID=2028575 RepID=A0A3A1Y7B2_9GAMM|nr:amidohydrolase [Psittacicella hinzii]
MPQTLAQAPYLVNWGKQVDDLGAQDLTRPRVIKQADSLQKLMQTGESRLAEMDEHGIDMQVLSYAASPQLIEDKELAVTLITQANDHLAQIKANNPDRFAGFATLPWQDPEAALTELDRVVKLGFTGVLLNGRPSADFLDHPKYAQVLAKMNEHKMVLFLHPGVPNQEVQQAYYAGFNDEVSARLSMFAWGWHNESGIQLIRLILSGALDRNRDLKIISGHWGELMPFYLQRMDDSIPLEASGLERTLLQTVKDQVYITNSGMTGIPHFNFIREVVGIDNMLFSVDYPYLSLNGARAFVESLPLSDEDKEKFAYKNAAKLLRLDV